MPVDFMLEWAFILGYRDVMVLAFYYNTDLKTNDFFNDGCVLVRVILQNIPLCI